MINLLPQLQRQFLDRVAVFEKRPGVMQIAVPLYHEDGDMVDLYVEQAPQAGLLRVCDHGMTMMRLSYAIEDMTPARTRVVERVLAEAGVGDDDGNLHLDVEPGSLVPALLQLAQVEARLGTMRLFRRETVASLFQEDLDEFVQAELAQYQPQRRVTPIAARDDLEVDWLLNVGKHPHFLFGVRDVGRARLTTIACLEFQRAGVAFRSVVVHEAMEALPKKDRVRLTSAADKQFPTFEDFRELGRGFFARGVA